jgi:Tol biopolymer transport system component
LRVTVVDTATGAVHPIGAGQSDGPPVPSPDGAWIAYTSRDGDRRVVRLVHPDGSGERIVPHAANWHDDPSWSPNGRWLAYSSGRDFAEKRVAVYTLANGEEATWGGEEGLGLMRPVFLSDVTKTYIVASAMQMGVEDKSLLGGMRLDSMVIAVRAVKRGEGMTTDVSLVTASRVLPPLFDAIMPHEGAYEEWAVQPSPDGKLIAFESNDGGDRELFLLSFKKGVYDLSNHYEADWNPVWGADSRYLFFESFRNGRRGVYRVYADTVRVTPVAVSENADNWAPAASPDGEQVAFVSDREGTPDLYIAASDGTDPRALVSSPGLELAPVWITVADR